MNPRFAAVAKVAERKVHGTGAKRRGMEEHFGSLVFGKEVIERMLPKKVAQNLLQAIQGKERVHPDHGSTIATAMKDWAIEQGATHYCHWFQPMTGTAAEKHDAFLDWKGPNQYIERLSGKQLMRGEPDASSFPSGGLRTTASARGYTSWDPTSPVFLWKSGGETVLCIPSVFFSWSGEALDMKIPLLRSDAKMNQAAVRLLHLLGVEGESVYSTLGCEQEYFLIDKAFAVLRPDLLMTGRTVCGAPSSKGQELEDHYFGPIKERVLAFMAELEVEAAALGIPLKTRHCEVAPSQFEVAPIFEKASIAVDHNILLMALMKEIANRHHFFCLLHEKPFARINGSGKHCNWSLSTDRGLNLFDPSDSLLFLILVAATLQAIHTHAPLLRAAIGSAANDHRLGGHEAPPVIISVYLGQALEKLLTHIEQDKVHKSAEGAKLDLGVPIIPEIPLDDTDRNRTSPFAFTGNKFEFRAVGASANCALPITVVNVIVAQSLNQLIDEIERKRDKGKSIEKAAMEVIRSSLKSSKPIRFSGNNYSEAWFKEAKKRKLPILSRATHAFEYLAKPAAVEAFHGVLSKEELHSRYEILCERYAKVISIESRLLEEIFRTQVLPSAAQSGGLYQKRHFDEWIETGLGELKKLESLNKKGCELEGEKLARFCSDEIAPQMDKLRHVIDTLEMWIADHLWPLPKYREMLNLL